MTKLRFYCHSTIMLIKNRIGYRKPKPAALADLLGGVKGLKRMLQCLGRHAGGRIAVAGLNPHAGEGGLLGSEEEEVIRPAVAESRRRGLDVCIHRVEDACWPLLLRIEAGLDVARVIGDSSPPIERDSRTLPTLTGVEGVEGIGADVEEGGGDRALALAATLERIAVLFERGWIFGAERVGSAGEGTGSSSE